MTEFATMATFYRDSHPTSEEYQLFKKLYCTGICKENKPFHCVMFDCSCSCHKTKMCNYKSIRKWYDNKNESAKRSSVKVAKN